MQSQEPQNFHPHPVHWYRGLDSGKKYLVKLAAAGLTLGFIGWLYIPRSAFYWHYGDQLLGGIVAGIAIAKLTDHDD